MLPFSAPVVLPHRTLSWPQKPQGSTSSCHYQQEGNCFLIFLLPEFIWLDFWPCRLFSVGDLLKRQPLSNRIIYFCVLESFMLNFYLFIVSIIWLLFKSFIVHQTCVVLGLHRVIYYLMLSPSEWRSQIHWKWVRDSEAKKF